MPQHAKIFELLYSENMKLFLFLWEIHYHPRQKGNISLVVILRGLSAIKRGLEITRFLCCDETCIKFTAK